MKNNAIRLLATHLVKEWFLWLSELMYLKQTVQWLVYSKCSINAATDRTKNICCVGTAHFFLPQLLVFQILSVIILDQPSLTPPRSFLVRFSHLRQPSQKSSVIVLAR